jgi:hypothetical protein
VRGHGTNGIERRARTTDEAVLNGQNGFGDDGEMAGEEEVIDSDDRAGESVFDGGEEGVSGAFVDGTEGGVESGAGDGSDSRAKKLESGFFAERAGLTLEGDAHL